LTPPFFWLDNSRPRASGAYQQRLSFSRSGLSFFMRRQCTRS
jgi:hypothetical protein